MPINPWLALDAATPPASLARDLRRAWELFLTGGEPDAVRAPIAASWQRSQAAGVDPLVERVAPVAANVEEASARWDVHPLAVAAPLIHECLEALEAQHLVVVGDADGTLLWVEGDPAVRLEAADSMNFTEGAAWSETGAGTNAIGIALAAGHAAQVFAGEHFNSVVQAWVCSAAPVVDPDSGDVIGVIDLTARMADAHPHVFTAAIATAKAVEAQLRADMHERDARLRSRYADGVAGPTGRALVTPSGRFLAGDRSVWLGEGRLAVPPGGGELVLASGTRAFLEPLEREQGYIAHRLDDDRGSGPRPLLRLRLLGNRISAERDGRALSLSRRHFEILELLLSRRDGLTSEQLAADLYGDAGRPGTVRVEISRLRKALGGGIEADPYRLTINVESDLGRVRGLLARSVVREAAECYSGTLLPESEAPGVVRDRDELEAWLRHAVMTADDTEALWAWVQCPSGRGDLPAWRRLVAAVPFRDPRRSLAVASVQALRDSYGA